MRAALSRLDALAGRAIAGLARLSWLGPVLIVLAAAAATLPGQRALPVLDRDEARFVQASRQMLETGDFVDPRNQDAPRYKKPVGIYWLQSAAAVIDGRGAEAPIHVYRAASVAGIALAGLFTWWAFLPLIGPAAAALAGAMVVTAAVSIGEAHIAKTDAALLAVTTAAQAALIRVWLAARDGGGPHPARWLFWVALAAGTLIKGPIAPAVALATALVLSARDRTLALWRGLSPLRGVLLFLILALPWFVAIGIQSGGAFFTASFGEDFLGKIDQGAEGHGGPPGYYLMTVWVSFWPWAPFALLALPQLWHDRRAPLAVAALAWIVPLWLTFELTATKLPHYILPVLPAVAALAATAVLRPEPQNRTMRALAALLLIVGGAVLSAVIVGGPLLIDERPEAWSVPLAVLGLALTLTGAWALAIRLRGAATLLVTAAALVLMPTFIARTLTNLPVLFPAERMAALDAQLDACAPAPVASVGLTEMSLVVRGGTDTRFPDAESAAAILAANDGGRVFVTDADGALARAVTEKLGLPPQEIARFDTINYNRSERRLSTRLLIHPDDTILAGCLPLAQ